MSLTNHHWNLQAKAQSIDFIIDTVAVKHPLDPYLATLKTNGKLCMVGVPLAPHEFTPYLLNAGKLSVKRIIRSFSIRSTLSNFLSKSMGSVYKDRANKLHLR